MTAYALIVPKSVQKQLDKLPDEVFRRVLKKIKQLSENPRPAGVLKLKGKENEYRIRVGDYRIRYKIDEVTKSVILGRCQHRKDVYQSD